MAKFLLPLFFITSFFLFFWQPALAFPDPLDEKVCTKPIDKKTLKSFTDEIRNISGFQNAEVIQNSDGVLSIKLPGNSINPPLEITSNFKYFPGTNKLETNFKDLYEVAGIFFETKNDVINLTGTADGFNSSTGVKITLDYNCANASMAERVPGSTDKITIPLAQKVRPRTKSLLAHELTHLTLARSQGRSSAGMISEVITLILDENIEGGACNNAIGGYGHIKDPKIFRNALRASLVRTGRNVSNSDYDFALMLGDLLLEKNNHDVTKVTELITQVENIKAAAYKLSLNANPEEIAIALGFDDFDELTTQLHEKSNIYEDPKRGRPVNPNKKVVCEVAKSKKCNTCPPQKPNPPLCKADTAPQTPTPQACPKPTVSAEETALQNTLKELRVADQAALKKAIQEATEEATKAGKVINKTIQLGGRAVTFTVYAAAIAGVAQSIIVGYGFEGSLAEKTVVGISTVALFGNQTIPDLLLNNHPDYVGQKLFETSLEIKNCLDKYKAYKDAGSKGTPPSCKLPPAIFSMLKSFTNCKDTRSVLQKIWNTAPMNCVGFPTNKNQYQETIMNDSIANNLAALLSQGLPNMNQEAALADRLNTIDQSNASYENKLIQKINALKEDRQVWENKYQPYKGLDIRTMPNNLYDYTVYLSQKINEADSQIRELQKQLDKIQKPQTSPLNIFNL